jgi:hypothetical protein
MYTVKNFRTKKALKDAIAAGEQVEVFQPGGMFATQREGRVFLEGPHFPHPHTWYAEARVADGIIVKGSVK